MINSCTMHLMFKFIVFNAKVGLQVVGNQMQGLYFIYFGLNTNNWCIGLTYEPQMVILKRKITF
jgi:hypothetical protein